MYQKMSLVKFATIFVATATVSQVLVKGLTQATVLAQSFGEIPETFFPIPDSLPEGTTLKVDGSTSMRSTNEDLENRFEKQFPNIDVQIEASRTDEAFRALIAGDIDILAAGRPLTEEEKAQNVIEISLEQREKLAIIVGPDNEFEGDLTFEQFARIFRGEISNWSEVGGPDLPIRVVDRPDYSDTRRALSTYNVFEGKPFETGATADPIADDETDAVVAALGVDGIGYTVVSQAIDRDDVRIIPMHQTLPDDPRYPYSQYRAFVYKDDAGPAALAFMGFATTEPGQEVFAAESAEITTADAPEAADTPETANASEATDTPETAGSTEATDTPTDALADDSADIPPTPVTTAEPGAGGFPFWILPLLAIPLLGAILWWLLKGAGASTAVAGGAAVGGAAAGDAAALSPRIVLTPRDSHNAYAYWEIPQECLVETRRQGGETMMLRLYDVTGRSKNAPLPAAVAEFPCLESNPDLHLPITMNDRSYCAEVGYLSKDNHWLPIVKSDPVRVRLRPESSAPSPATSEQKSADTGTLTGAALGGAVLAGATAFGATMLAGGKTRPPGRMVLTPRSSDDAYAYWEIPQKSLAEAKRQGGETLVARLYDVTERSADAAKAAAQLECTEADRDAHFAVAANRDYMAKIGYQTASGDWLPLAQSNSIRVPEKLATDASANDFPGGAAVLGGAGTAAGAGAAAFKQAKQPATSQSRIVITPQTAQQAYTYWEVPETAKTALKAEGGQSYQLRIHDVTGIELNRQPPNGTQTYELAEEDCDRSIPLSNEQSDYVAEVGYQTAAGSWLPLTQSTPIKPAKVLTQLLDESSADTAPISMPIAAGAAVAGGLAAAATLQTQPTQGSTQIVKVHSRNNAVMFDQSQLHHIEHDVAVTHDLVPGTYILRLQDGVFNYDADDSHPGEPFVLLWIHGGTVINQKTGVPVSSTWTTLNGYDDTLVLDVREPIKLCAFFIDTYPDDNSGEVTLSIIKQ